MKYERLGKMRIFETHSGLTRLLICMLYEGPSDVTRTKEEANICQHQMYPFIRTATEDGFIISDFDMDSHYRERRLQQTEEGNYIAKRLDEISIALSGN